LGHEVSQSLDKTVYNYFDIFTFDTQWLFQIVNLSWYIVHVIDKCDNSGEEKQVNSSA